MADIVQLGLSLDASKVLTARDKANRALGSIAKSSKKTQASVSALQKGFGRLAAGAAGLIGIAALTRGFRAMVEATRAGEQSAAKVTSVLRATGFAAGRTATQIDRLSEAMADSTLFDDDAIRDTAAILLTFRNVQGQVFDDAIGLIADMATVLGTDLKSAAIQVGKALNDPVARLSDLSRAGITFTQAQKDMVRAMAEAGDIAGAQGVILRELRGEFGGAAAGANVGLFGAITQTSKAWVDFLEAVGRSESVFSVLVPAFKGLTRLLKNLVPTTDLEVVTIQLEEINTELDKLEGRQLKRQGTLNRITELRAEAANLENVKKSIIDQQKAAADAAREAADDAKAAGDREVALALERDTRLKAAQEAARDFNEKQKVLARAWERSWGRAIENTQDSFAAFFESLLTGGVDSFRDFAKQVLDIWIKLSAQIAATKLFEQVVKLAPGLVSGGGPDLMEIPTSVNPAGDFSQVGGQTGGVTVSQTFQFNVMAMDGASFAQFAQQNRAIIAGAAAQGARDSIAVRRMLRGR